MEVLFFYTLFSFLMVSWDWQNAIAVPLKYMPWIAMKSLVLFGAWMLSFKALKNLPLSLYGVLDLSRVLFATILAVLFLHEEMDLLQVAGLLLVCIGLFALKYSPASSESRIPAIQIALAMLSCVLQGVSGLLDKVIMKDVNSNQLLFWYLLFMIGFYLIYMLITRTGINVKKTLKNKWIYMLAALLVIADKCVFIANADPNSKVTIMTLIKQSGAIVTILAGRFLFKEKNTTHKLICAAIIIAGITLSVI